ncbi:mitochondrial 37S ribosomal protein uS2m [Calcarisporiella thermophila]|uniref:mitochondrial 37S ribosomal protein uS2m n=1 Tax=Calcarisporiella thermophila TaxID=911321 RepID=UPI003742763A
MFNFAVKFWFRHTIEDKQNFKNLKLWDRAIIQVDQIEAKMMALRRNAWQIASLQSRVLTRALNTPSENRPQLSTEELKKRFEKLLPEYEQIGSTQHTSNVSPPSPTAYDLTIPHLLAANLHLGHSTSLWNAHSLPFVFGTRAGISIINLAHTLVYLRRACALVREVAYRGGNVLFVGTRPQIGEVVAKAAQECGALHVTKRWLPGTLTNAQQVLGALGPDTRRKLKPDLILVMNPIENEIVLAEANACTIPVVAITDTDYDPRRVTYPIPANDDSVRGVELIAGVLSKAVKEGTTMRRHELDTLDRQKKIANRQ